ncbi:hypothetical protein ILUMI_08053 [Ignelater luminosus]|uniref:Uncharacterized protein n=1 Tax=Ignelater luminosus TaxID=2038154 RepID=A0A8K0D561_IGNLU|nr:hypothetical protein ILUMI_08053 [Ignelater luminosus]
MPLEYVTSSNFLRKGLCTTRKEPEKIVPIGTVKNISLNHTKDELSPKMTPLFMETRARLNVKTSAPVRSVTIKRDDGVVNDDYGGERETVCLKVTTVRNQNGENASGGVVECAKSAAVKSAMSCGSLPPLPGLIPISALRKSPSCSNNNDLRECTPCAVQKEVMGEQRSRRTGSQPSVDLIDIARRSRGFSATPQAPSGKAERHRKSDRRRGEHRGGRKRSVSKRRETSPTPEEEEKCVNPRVNPIFVWVRQEDTHIVDVKCEDYDKRNRIVLTKTAQGWRAIPRTETLVPNLKVAAALDDDEEVVKHQTRKVRKSHKVKRKSAAVQVDEVQTAQDAVEPPTWDVPINIESHLPSHTIQIHRKRSPTPEQIATADDATVNVNTSVEHDYSAQVSTVECSASKVCDVSPLDNLLAVAELEFNQQIQTEAWCENASNMKICDENTETLSKEYDVDVSIENKNDECNDATEPSNGLHELPVITPSEAAFDSEEDKDDDCDYNEEDENNLAMDDILTRLEQSLQSPDALCMEMNDSIEQDIPLKEQEKSGTEVPEDALASYNFEDFVEMKEDIDSDKTDARNEEAPECVVEPCEQPEPSDLTVGSTTTNTTEITNVPIETSDDKPTDLSTSKKVECLTINLPDDDLMPTDLSLPKNKPKSPVSPRPSSRCSETIQSPQPSGLPAVPHSPDVQMSTKSAYLESLLSSTSQKISLNSEVTITRQKEPLDFGKCRKSASPTVTCSEEVNSSSGRDGEPEPKKTKLDDITLRAILDANTAQSAAKDESSKNQQKNTKNLVPETSRLLELLTSESEPDPFTQFKQLLSDSSINVPDPLLIPKDRLSQILMSPGKEIPRLLAQRPELKLPEALTLPHLLHDPDILVITLAKLEAIIRKQALSLPSEKVKQINNGAPPVKKGDTDNPLKSNTEKDKSANNKPQREHGKTSQTSNGKEMGRTSELCNEVNLANTNALNQMMWLPYLQQLEVAAMAFGNGADFLKMLSSAFPPYSNQVPDMSQLFAMNRFPQPPGFPIPPTNNPFEFPLWHEAAAGHANLQRTVSQFERNCTKNAYREYIEKMTMASTKSHQTSSHKYSSSSSTSSNSKTHPFTPSMYHQNASALHNMQQHPFMNVPATYQPPNLRHNLQIPQFNSMLSQKNPLYSKGSGKTSPPSSSSSINCDSKTANFNNFYGSRTAPNQSGDNFSKSLKFDDIPEVGSTTASIEDMTAHMQESQKHLWHPLFGK